MADTRLRQLERTASQGDPQAQVHLLLQRVRVGELSRHQLELAAYLHHLPALVALGREVGSVGDLSCWVEGLERWGREVCARAALRAACLVRGPFEEWLRLQPASCRELRAALDVSIAWLDEMCERDRATAEKRYLRFMTRAGHRLYGIGPDCVAATAVSEAVRSVFQEDYALAAGNAVRSVVKSRSPRVTLIEICRYLLPLALGESRIVRV